MADPSSASSPSRPQSPYPVACPKCGQRAGQPYDVFMAGKNVPITVYVECEACQCQWCVDGPLPLVMRRKSP